MKINSVFTDYYDFSPVCDFADTLVYNRRYAERTIEIDNTDALYLLLGNVLLVFKLVMENGHIFSKPLYPAPDSCIERYSIVKKRLVPTANTQDNSTWYMSVFSKPTDGQNITSVDGELLLTKQLKEALLDNKYHTCTIVDAEHFRNRYGIQEPIALINTLDKGYREKEAVVHQNFSLMASGLRVIVTNYLGLDEVAATIDNFLARDIPIINKDSDLTKLESAGFDKKVSFRHRK